MKNKNKEFKPIINGTDELRQKEVSGIEEKEFNLSNEEMTIEGDIVYPSVVVKEFISREFELIIRVVAEEITWKEFWEERDKLIGFKEGDLK